MNDEEVDEIAAKKHLLSIVKEADVPARKRRYGQYLVDACSQKNVNRIRLVIELWWHPFHTKIVDNMIECMQLSADGLDVDPTSYRQYLLDIEDAYDDGYGVID